MLLSSKNNIMNKIKKSPDPKSHAEKGNDPRGKVNTDKPVGNKASKSKPAKNVPSSPTTEVNPEG